MYVPMLLVFGIHFVMLLVGKTRYPGWILTASFRNVDVFTGIAASDSISRMEVFIPLKSMLIRGTMAL